MKTKVDNKKIIKALLLVGGGIGIVYLFTKALNKKSGTQNQQGNFITNPTNAPLEVSVVKPTLSENKLKSHANTLTKAFNGDGTDEQAIYDVFTDVKNDVDFNNLVTKFGVRTVKGGLFTNTFKGNLRSVIKNEMDSNEIKFLNQILQSNGVSKQFTY